MNQSARSSTGSNASKQNASDSLRMIKGNAISRTLGKASVFLGFKKKYNLIFCEYFPIVDIEIRASRLIIKFQLCYDWFRSRSFFIY